MFDYNFVLKLITVKEDKLNEKPKDNSNEGGGAGLFIAYTLPPNVEFHSFLKYKKIYILIWYKNSCG